MRAVGLSLCCLLCVTACEGAAPSLDAATALDAGTTPDAASDASVATDSGAADAAGLDAGAEDASSAPDASTRPLIDMVIEALEGSDGARIDALMHEVAWGSGWPLHEGTRWLFVTRQDDRPARVALVGHVNEWDVDADVATRAATGVHYWVLVEEADFVAPAEGAKYKWLIGADDYRAPLEATRYGYDDFGRFGWVIPDLATGHLEQFPDFDSAHLDSPRAFRAYLPPGFVARSTAAAQARTLLLHDGQNVFHPDAIWGGWGVDEALAGDASFGDVVAVAVDNAPDRMSAYTHVEDDIGELTGGRADDYLRLLVEEALPFFRARYGIVAEGQSLAVAGSSLGGLVSVYLAMRHPTLASCAAGMSSTLAWGSFRAGATGDDALPLLWPAVRGHEPVAIYLDSGGSSGGTCIDSDGDRIRDDGDDSDNHCATLQMRDALVAEGYVLGTDLAYAWASGAAHNEAAWRARVPGMLGACAAMGWIAP